MSALPGSPADAPSSDAIAREQLTSLQGLLVLSMLMAESGHEQRILHLATTAVPSLCPCRLEAAYLLDRGWLATTGACDLPDVRLELEAAFEVLSGADGALAVLHARWSWAYPLRSLDGHFGYLIVTADEEPLPHDHFLLRVLAQQTGIALASARLHARDQASAAELREANTTLTATVAALEQSTAIHERLTRVAVDGEGQAGLARAVHELTGFPVLIEDRYGNVRASGGTESPDIFLAVSSAQRDQALQRALREGRPTRADDRVISVASPGHDLLGVLAIVDPDSRADSAAYVALEHGATVLAMELARLYGLEESELRLGRELLDELLVGTDDDRARRRAELRGYDLERPHRVVVVESVDATDNGDTLFHAVRRAARDLSVGTLLSARGTAVVVLSNAYAPWDEFRAAVLGQLGKARCRVGIGGSATGPRDLPRSYREAQLALKIQASSGTGDRATEFDELGIYTLLAEVEETESVERFARKWLDALIKYDEQKGSELVFTLTRYLESGGSLTTAAAAASVHRSTLKYRMRRVKEISGHDVSDPEIAFNLQVATRVWQMLVALRRTS